MNDAPYTTPEEDPFNVQPLFRIPRRRRSSLLDKWIEEQQKQPTDVNQPAQDTDPHEHPDTNKDDVVSLNSYDLVDDDDIPPSEVEVPSTPVTAFHRRTPKRLHTPSSFRNFSISFRSTSPAPSQLPDTSSPRPSRFSFLPRSPRHSVDSICPDNKNTHFHHNKSPSLSTLDINGKSPYPIELANTSPPSRWRPSVLGHFSASATSQTSVVPSDSAYTPSRPSISSGDTYTSATATTAESDFPITPSKLNFMDSIRYRSSLAGSPFKSGSRITSSSTVWPHIPGTTIDCASTSALSIAGSALPSTSTSTLSHKPPTSRIPLASKPRSHLANSNISHDNDDINNDAMRHTIKQPTKHPTRPYVAYVPGGSLPRVNFSSLSTRHKKKKKLVISGIGPNESRKFQGVKRWCESFGEVSQIVRMPNGDLHVHFRLADVADTVCRLRAKVYIAGVGSVQLSWFTGDKR